MANQTDPGMLETCEAAARAGAAELVAWRGRFTTQEKGITDYVTDADLASQAAIRRVIAERYPDHGFIGEEQPPESFPGRDDGMNWIVDPLDGTTNYVHGFPIYAVSVAVARGNNVLAGVVYDPNMEQTFSAATEQGAWCNGVRLKTSLAKRASDALVAVSLPARVERTSPDLWDFVEATQVCQGVRRSGSAALNMANVARGTLDAFWASHIHPWDVAAGVLFVREAGGIVTGRHGGEFDLWDPHFIAAASIELHRELLQTLTPYKHR
jgi:myo-inositol-1(or 4)-monophosphatase